MVEQNKTAYDSNEVINHYTNYHFLQKPEEAIFGSLTALFPRMKMLDVGVGTGRTTTYFVNKVLEYKAVDYSSKMTEHCRIKFKDLLPAESFSTADARDLSAFPAGYFDFVLFSFNGIDNVTYEERITVLNEVKRILSPGGYFCFSSHNTRTIKTWNSIRFSLNPYSLYQNIIAHYKRKKINRLDAELFEKIDKLHYIHVNDGAHDWKLQLSYINPVHQMDQLRAVGFKDISAYDLTRGKKMTEDDLHGSTDKWIYYLCRI